MKSAAIRQAFLDYFAKQGHTIVPSSSLIPHNDPTLLFTNAGMNQFKETFLGREKRDYTRAASSQRCVRAGGKHNDLENVGYTARHHTFFEMLGNFSFGDYFKEEAIRFAWEFLTSKDWLGIPREKLMVTVYERDDEAYNIWKDQVGVPEARIIRIGDKPGGGSDNFWQMGDTGPCGPCTEIFYDHGEEIWGGPPGSPEEDGDRFIEIWNVVFMQYDRQPDGTLAPLPKPSVDTGMGLERIAAVMQGVHNNYEIDLFQRIIAEVQALTGCEDAGNQSLRVIADHIRSCAFLISDGVIPSNEGRGYVLRRIIRRAIRHGHKLGMNQPFFHQLVGVLGEVMGDAYPEIVTGRERIEKALLAEEEQFAKTLDQGMKILEEDLASLAGDVIPGEVIFKLYDTYGFPADLTGDIARERGLSLDMVGFEQCMEAQRERARAAGSFANDYHDKLEVDSETTFIGYDADAGKAPIMTLFSQGEAVSALQEGEQGMIVLESTPFYGESGGQVGDTGFLRTDSGEFHVTDTTRKQGAFLHHGVVTRGTIQADDTVEAVIDVERRNAIRRHHSATHLLHAALRQVLGDHVAQKGSLVGPDYLRFDFSHNEALTHEQIRQLEDIVNRQVLANTPVTTELMDIDQARSKGAMALFGEKYDDQVRVLTMGVDNFSMELCGGTHVGRTGDIGLFKIVSEGGVAAGVRRIEAVAGEAALDWINEQQQQLSQIAELFKVNRAQAAEKAGQLIQRVKELEKEIGRLKQKLASGAGADAASQIQEVEGVKVLATVIDGADAKSLRGSMDQMKTRLGSAVIVLAAVNDGKVALVAGVTDDLTDRFNAGKLVNHVASQVGGKGGGRADMAQAGGSDPSALPAALESVVDWVAQMA